MVDGSLEKEKFKFTLRQDIEIIIVEDDSESYLRADNYLRSADIKNIIHWFENGQAVLCFLEGDGCPSKSNNKYIILLNIQLPGIDGIEVLRRMKNDDKLRHVNVIMLATSDDQQRVRECYGLGCRSHVIKPHGDSLLKAIERISERM